MSEEFETCPWCGGEIGVVVGCEVQGYRDFADGVERNRIRYGDEVHESGAPGKPRALTRLAGMRAALPPGVDWYVVHETIANRTARVSRCSYCGVEQGSMHHPGCVFEECPRCHTQALSCECALVDAELTHRNLPAAWGVNKAEVFRRLLPDDTDLSAFAQPAVGERWGYTRDGIQLDGIGPIRFARGIPPYDA